MSADPLSNYEPRLQLCVPLTERWQDLCARYLPIFRENSIWRYSREAYHSDATQGWKLHVSATLLTATAVFERVGPFLHGEGVQFKGPASLAELARLNSGVRYGYSQVGKCFTVYPRNDVEAIALAEKLDELTVGITAPNVPFDRRLKPESCVYYRYGAFNHREIVKADGTRVLTLESPEGLRVPDIRTEAAPHWVIDPFAESASARNSQTPDNPLATTYRVFQALSQRGKGGVYLAVDMGSLPERLCVIKEGRKNGEPEWGGRDGCWRIGNEQVILQKLKALGVEVPLVYDTFEVEKNFYLVTEFIEGPNLQSVLNRRKTRLPISQVLRYGIQIATILNTLHRAGWIWRDCKPSNLALTRQGTLRPFDFEGACLHAESDTPNWATPVFAAPELNEMHYHPANAEDLYAFGVTLYLLLAGRYPTKSDRVPVEKLRRNVPGRVCRVVSALLDGNPAGRPSAWSVAKQLESALATTAGAG